VTELSCHWTRTERSFLILQLKGSSRSKCFTTPYKARNTLTKANNNLSKWITAWFLTGTYTNHWWNMAQTARKWSWVWPSVILNSVYKLTLIPLSNSTTQKYTKSWSFTRFKSFRSKSTQTKTTFLTTLHKYNNSCYNVKWTSREKNR